MKKLKRKPTAKNPAPKRALKPYNITMGNRAWERFKKNSHEWKVPEGTAFNLFLLLGRI